MDQVLNQLLGFGIGGGVLVVVYLLLRQWMTTAVPLFIGAWKEIEGERTAAIRDGFHNITAGLDGVHQRLDSLAGDNGQVRSVARAEPAATH